jgi:hypothetical protein
MIECSLAQGCEWCGVDPTLAVSPWQDPLSPPGFSASNPITGLSH